MRLYQGLALLLTLFFLLMSAGCGVKKLPGCATAAEVLPRELAAIKNGDREDLAMCCGDFARAKQDTARSMVDIILLSNDMQPIIIEGVKKFGAAGFSNGVGSLTTMLLSTFGDMPFELLVAKGTLTIKGDSATCAYKSKGKGDEMLPKQPELASFARFCRGNSINHEVSIPLEKIDGRWYSASTKADASQLTQMQQVHQALVEYLPQLRKGIKQSRDAKALTAFMTDPNAKLQAAVSPKR